VKTTRKSVGRKLKETAKPFAGLERVVARGEVDLVLDVSVEVIRR
jgi:hypothetical protein